MPEYRIYPLNWKDKIKGPPTIIECSDDNEAIEQAK
jgi:hypothetical protein